jgi:hypothetical protein
MTVQMMVIVSVAPTVAGAVMVAVAPGKGATPNVFVVVDVDPRTSVSPTWVEVNVLVILKAVPAKSVVKGLVTVTNVVLAGIAIATVVPAGAVDVIAGGGVTASDLPVIVRVAKLVRLAVVAITVIVWVPLNPGGVNVIATVPELLVLNSPRKTDWVPIWALNEMGTPIRLECVGLV